MKKNFTIFFDGASKGNPGPAGIGAVVMDDSQKKHEVKKFIGITTNNQAEYSALIEGLQEATRLGATHIDVYSDSELVVRQLNGEYQIKDPKLKVLYQQVIALNKNFQGIKFTHVPREQNKEADALANEAVNLERERRSGKPMSTGATKEETKFFDFCASPIEREKAEVMVYGLPYQGTVNSRPGAIQGPEAIRNATKAVESYSPFFDKDLSSLAFYDDGDIPHYGTGKMALESMATAIKTRLVKNAKVVFLGGDHSTTYSPVKALVEQGEKFSIIHLDAHPDCQDAFEGDPWCYATVMRRIKEFLPGEIYQLGIRTCTKEELEFASKTNKLFLCDRFLEGLKYIEKQTKGKKIYVSYDIDALDPSLAPGTSNPEYGGLLYDQIRLLLNTLKQSNVIGFDIVEVAPNLDPSGLTPIIASQLARDSMLAWWVK